MFAWLGWIILALIVGFFIGVASFAIGMADGARKKLSTEELMELARLMRKIK